MTDSERLEWIATHLIQLTTKGNALVLSWWHKGEGKGRVVQYEGTLVNALRLAVDKAAGEE